MDVIKQDLSVRGASLKNLDLVLQQLERLGKNTEFYQEFEINDGVDKIQMFTQAFILFIHTSNEAFNKFNVKVEIRVLFSGYMLRYYISYLKERMYFNLTQELEAAIIDEYRKTLINYTVYAKPEFKEKFPDLENAFEKLALKYITGKEYQNIQLDNFKKYYQAVKMEFEQLNNSYRLVPEIDEYHLFDSVK